MHSDHETGRKRKEKILEFTVVTDCKSLNPTIILNILTTTE